MAEAAKPGAAAPGQTTAPVAAGATGAKPPTPPAPVTAVASVPKFGGNRGGRKREDGLVPGSPEALEVDREKDRQRKKAERDAAARLAEPPALPSAVTPLSGPSQAPLVGQIPGVVAPGAEPVIPWDPETIKPLILEALDAAEKSRIKNFIEAGREAKLGDQLLRQIAADAHYLPAAKSSLGICGPRAICKILNQLGVSGKYSDEAISILCLLQIFIQGKRQETKLEELIHEAKKQNEKAAGATAQNQNPH